jgi:hypothetical protein
MEEITLDYQVGSMSSQGFLCRRNRKLFRRMEEGAMSQGVQADSRHWQSQGSRFSIELQGEGDPVDMLFLAP